MRIKQKNARGYVKVQTGLSRLDVHNGELVFKDDLSEVRIGLEDIPEILAAVENGRQQLKQDEEARERARKLLSQIGGE